MKDITDFTKKNNINKPLALKVSPDIANSEVGSIIESIKKFKINAIIISNTTDKNRENLIGRHKSETGGLSGEPLSKISNNLINNNP